MLAKYREENRFSSSIGDALITLADVELLNL
jgi:hypothetical protein